MDLSNNWKANFIHHSNGIEGIYIAESNILAQLSGTPVRRRTPYIDNQLKAIDYIIDHKDEAPTPRTIQELHGILMGGILESAGEVRECQVFVGKHIPPKPQYVRAYLRQLCSWWYSKPMKSWIKKKAALFRHYEFEFIHPFVDGNGRVGRLLYLWDCLLNNTEMDIIKCDLQSRKSYYKALDQYRSTQRQKYLDKWC